MQLYKGERQLNDEQQMLRMVAENITDLIGILDVHGVVVYASQTHRTLLGIDPEKYVGQSAFLRVHDDDLPTIQKQLSTILTTKRGLRSEFRYLHSSGHYVTVEANVEPVVDQSGDVSQVVIVARDVTDKRRAEAILKGQNEVLSLTAKDAPIEEVFVAITKQVEALYDNVVCAITMLSGNEVLHVAPSLAPKVRDAINSMQVTEFIQQYLYEEFFVTESSDAPKYRRLRDWVRRNHYTAVWSKPIQTSDGIPIGIFAVLYKGAHDTQQLVGSDLYNAYAQIATLAIKEKQSRKETAVREQQYKSLFNNNLDAIYQFDLNGYFTDANQALIDMVGYSLDELRGMHFLEVIASDDVEPSIVAFEKVKCGRTIPLELTAYHKNSNPLRLHTVNLPIVIDGKVTGTYGIAKDITSLRYSQELLQNQKRVLEMIAKGSSLEEVLYELTKVVEYHIPTSMCNVFLLLDDHRTLQHITGHEKLKEYTDSLGIITIGPDTGACGTAPFLNQIVIVEDIEIDPLYKMYRSISMKHGLRACFATPIVSSSGQVLGVFGLYYDKVKRPHPEDLDLLRMLSHLAGLAVEHKKADEEIRHLAHYDALTGLPNRTVLFEQLSDALKQAAQENHQMAVMFLDLDRFKSFNDSLGHHFGDRVLRVAAERMKEACKEEYTVFRMGGDEFSILLPKISTGEDAWLAARNVIDSFDTPVELDGHELRLTTSIGIAIFPEHGDRAETLIRKADVAMYVAKGSGKNRFRLYTNSMSEEFYERLMMESSLRRGLENNEFVVHYQPRVDVRSHAVSAIEALIRWNKPGCGLIPPADFIPVAEETGLIVSIGKWVFYEVCRQIKEWETMGRPPVRIAVNVSPRQFQEPDLMEMIQETIHMTGVDPRWLEIEITESGLIKNEHGAAIKVLNELKAMGIKISIDDFGVGYSSLSRLKQMPVDTLKIDRSFIRDIFEDGAAITKTIITLAQSLRMNVVAEGVETEEQLKLLQELGCDEIQGYLITAPLPINEIELRYMSPC